MMVLLAPGQKSDVERMGDGRNEERKKDATKTQYTALGTSHACWRKEAGEGPGRALFIAGDRPGWAVGEGLPTGILAQLILRIFGRKLAGPGRD
jgi:hypothetical protein